MNKPDELFIRHLKAEIERARTKFPDSNKMLAAITEGVGELAEALLKITEDGPLDRGELNTRLQKVYNEAVQVAATALRLAVEGDKAMDYNGTRCSYGGCSQPAMGGPCPICYEQLTKVFRPPTNPTTVGSSLIGGFVGSINPFRVTAMKIQLGMKVKDKVTGFIGVVENRATYLHGCDRLCIQPPVKEDGTIPKSEMIDEPQLEILMGGVQIIKPLTSVPVKVILGIEVVDPVSGIKGIATGRAVYLNGCARILISPKHEGKPVKDYCLHWVDEPQVEIVQSGLFSKPRSAEQGNKKTGGPALSSSKR